MRRVTLKTLARRVLRSRPTTELRFRIDRRLGRLAGDSASRQRFSIGVLFGREPFKLSPLSGVANPVVTTAMVDDADAAFVADPFLFRHHDLWYLFFELWNRHSKKGEIAVATSPDAAAWQYLGIVHREPFHLSYPLVFEHEGDIFMLPETHASDEVRLYRCLDFPSRWRPDAVLLEGCYCDATVFQDGGLWWMFAMRGSDPGGGPLDMFWSERLTSGWTRHPRSPLPADAATESRPAGRVVRDGSKLYRFGQSARPWYGTSVTAFEVLELTTDAYQERRTRPVGHPLLTASGCGWNRHGMHHIDLTKVGDGWIAAVDGWVGGPHEDWDGATVKHPCR